MTDIVIHIGLTKTASTFFQKKIFFGKIYTNELAIKWEKDRIAAKKFQDDFLRDDYSFDTSIFGLAFFEKLKERVAGDRIVISHESLFRHDPFLDDYAELACSQEAFVKKIGGIRAAWRYGKVKILLIHRVQWEWLPSMYANSAYLIRNASQADFEQKVLRFLDQPGDVYNVINWSELISRLSRAVGSDNLLAANYEEFREPMVWRRIAEFCGLKHEITEELLHDKSVNVKRYADEGAWVSSDRFQILADKKYLQRLRPIAKKFFSHRRRQQALELIGLGAPTIKMPSDLKRVVKERYTAARPALKSGSS